MSAEAPPRVNEGLSRWLGRGAAITILMMSVVGAYWLGTRGREWSAPNRSLIITEEDLTFAEVEECKTFKWPLRVVNSTADTITVKNWMVSCNCVVIEPPSISIASKQTATVWLTLDLTKPRTQNEQVSKWAFEAQLIPQIEGEITNQAGWTLRGWVRGVVSFSRPVVVFHEDCIRGGPVLEETVRVAVHVQADRLSVTCDPKFGKVTTTRSSSSNNEYQISIRPSEELPVGRFHFHVFVQPVGREGKQHLCASIPVIGLVREAVQADPPAVLFGTRIVGDTAEDYLVLKSVGTRAFTILGIETDSKHTLLEPVSLNNNGNQRVFKVTQTIVSQGSQESLIRFIIERERRTITLPVTVYYYGLPKSSVRGYPLVAGFHKVYSRQ